MTRGDEVKINFGPHKGKHGTIAANPQVRPRQQTLIFVDVPGVNRALLYYPSDLEAVEN